MFQLLNILHENSLSIISIPLQIISCDLANNTPALSQTLACRRVQYDY